MEKKNDDPYSGEIWHTWKFSKDAFSIIVKKITITLNFLFHAVRAKPESNFTACEQRYIHEISSREICSSAIVILKVTNVHIIL